MERRIGHVIKGSLGLQDVIANKVVQNEKEIAIRFLLNRAKPNS